MKHTSTLIFSLLLVSCAYHEDIESLPCPIVITSIEHSPFFPSDVVVSSPDGHHIVSGNQAAVLVRTYNVGDTLCR